MLPLLAVGGAAALSRRWGRLSRHPGGGDALRLCPGAAGFGMWLAHYSFHFLTSYERPSRRAALRGGPGLTLLGSRNGATACCRPVMGWLLRLEILFLDVGLLLSLYAGYRLAPSLKALVPWALLMVLLFAAGVWIVLQPMQMRGTF